MELLLELFLTTVLSVLIAFLLGKIVSIGAPEGDDPDARRDAEGVLAPLVSTVEASDGATQGSRVVLGGEVEREAFAIGGIDGGLHEEGRVVGWAAGDGCALAEEDRRVGEVGRREEEVVLVVEGGVVGSEEVGVEEVGGGEGGPGAAVEETEVNLADEPTEEIGRVIRRLAIEEKLLVANDAGQVVTVALSPAEEEEVAKELGTGEVVTESVKEDERLLLVEPNDDVKVVPCGMATEEVLESEDAGRETSVKNEKVRSSFNEDDDWEGIEKSDLEKLFAAATAFVTSSKGSEALARLSSDLQMQLYGLHKIVTEGPCYESHPMSLKVSARAKWHAWQRLGSMNPEMAMEQYITLVSDNIPGWAPQKNRDDDNLVEGEGDSPDKGISGSGAAFLSSSPEDQFFRKDERKLESHTYTGECNVPVVSEGTGQVSFVPIGTFKKKKGSHHPKRRRAGGDDGPATKTCRRRSKGEALPEGQDVAPDVTGNIARSLPPMDRGVPL